MIKVRVISAIWFGFLAEFSYFFFSFLTEKVDGYSPTLIFFMLVFPWGFLFGKNFCKCSFSSLRGLSGAIGSGFAVVLLSYLSFGVYGSILNFNIHEVLQSLIAGLVLIGFSMLFSMIITVPVGIAGAILLWLCFSLTEKLAVNKTDVT